MESLSVQISFQDYIIALAANPLARIVFVPMIISLLILVLEKNPKIVRLWAIIGTLIPLWDLVTSTMNFTFDPGPDPLFGKNYYLSLPWVDRLNITLTFGADGLNWPFVWLVFVVSLFAVLASYKITNRAKEFYFLMLLIQGALYGVFLSLDYFLFYIFWELTLIPMYFLIAIWGGANRQYAALKFLIYTLSGSIFMLFAIIGLYYYSGTNSFLMIGVGQSEQFFTSFLHIKHLVFLGLFLGFAVKIPMFPFHTWLPDAHVEAPTPVSMILAALLLKMGIYGFMRSAYYTLPDIALSWAPIIGTLAVIAIVYGGLVALAQRDFKRMIAYSSIAHMGFAMLGIASMNADGFLGATYMAVAHGIITAALFFLVGILEDRTGTREFSDLGGFMTITPYYSAILIFLSLASMGLPGLMSFWGEFLALRGAFTVPEYMNKVSTILGDGQVWFTFLGFIGILGILVAAVYFITMLIKVLMGPVKERWAKVKDIAFIDAAVLIPTVIIVFILGVFPAPLLEMTVYGNVDLHHSINQKFERAKEIREARAAQGLSIQK